MKTAGVLSHFDKSHRQQQEWPHKSSCLCDSIRSQKSGLALLCSASAVLLFKFPVSLQL